MAVQGAWMPRKGGYTGAQKQKTRQCALKCEAGCFHAFPTWEGNKFRCVQMGTC